MSLCVALRLVVCVAVCVASRHMMSVYVSAAFICYNRHELMATKVYSLRVAEYDAVCVAVCVAA